MTTSPTVSSPRQRARAQLTADIKEVARRQLAQTGPAGLSMRSIAQDVGLTSASALYRYFPGRDAILTALIVDAYNALGGAAEEAAAASGPTIDGRWMGICHAVRDWALHHRQEYTLIFGAPIPGYAAPDDTVAPAGRVPALLTGLLAELVADADYALDDILDDARPVGRTLHRALAPVRLHMPPAVPDALLIRGLMAWTYLFGAVSFELFGHRHDVVGDPAALFDYEMHTIAAALGVDGHPSSKAWPAPRG